MVYRISAAGDAAFLAEFFRSADAKTEIDAGINSAVHGLAQKVRGRRGVIDLVPAYASLLVCFDSEIIDRKKLQEELAKLADSAINTPCNSVYSVVNNSKTVRIPVCYEDEFAPDMETVCSHSGLSREEVVALHTAPVYRIYMLGFLPGFPYLGGLDPALETPRLATPRTKIPAGAVGIGGAQTGIYPLESPGGWQLIGRTPLKPYDPARAEPFLYRAGDGIKFEAVTKEEYCRLLGGSGEPEVRSEGGAEKNAAEKNNGLEMRPPPLSKKNSGVTIINPGMLTTVQDAGRFGYMESGFSPGGALDGASYALANELVGNEAGEAVLEMTMAGASFLFHEAATVAIAGADMKPLVNGFPAAMNEPFELEAGDILHTGFAETGVRAYLACAGGFAIEKIMGSYSTNLKAKIGGFAGRALQSGDTLFFESLTKHTKNTKKQNKYVEQQSCSLFPVPCSLTLHIVEGSQAAYFTEEGLRVFYSSVYAVGAESDRMGVRLEGPAVESRGGTDIVSDGIPLGAVQIPGSGKPIVMMADRQTTGGYAKIGALVKEDVWLLAQARPGTEVRFEKVECI